MDDDIDDDLLAAMLAEDEQDEARRNEEATLAPLMELTSSSVDTTPTNPAHYKLSDSDMGELFGCKKSASAPVPKQSLTTLSIGSNSQPTITPSVYLDPSTHIRIGSLNLTPSEIKTKLTLTKFIRLCEIDKHPPPMPAEWCTMAVLASKSDVKQASNGSTYSIWRITDFKTTVNMFLFGDAHQSLWKTSLSSVLLIYDGDTKKAGQLSIKHERNVAILGSNPDLGQCKAKAKSGEQCKNLVDRHACEYCVTHAHQIHKSDQRQSHAHAGNGSRMNLQSTGSFVPKKFADLSSGVTSSRPMASTKKRGNEPSKPSGNGLNEKEKSMLVMLGIEDDPLICIRTPDTKGLGDSIAEIREIYQAKQAAGKVKRVVYDETKNRDETNQMSHIRAYPLAASTSPDRKAAASSMSQMQQTSTSTKQFVDLTKSASSEAINSAKQRAIDILKQRLAQKQVTPRSDQSIVVADASSSPSSLKRAHADSDSDGSSKRLKVDATRFTDIMNMKSTYADLYSQMSLDEIFERYQKKENIEEKLLQVMERDIKVVVCRQCHYTAYKQSILCKQKQHFVKVCDVKQKFFECVQCSKRVFTWSQYPVDNCTNCHSLKGFRRTALIRERHGAKFDDEILLLRGEEEKFLNSFVSFEKLPSVID